MLGERFRSGLGAVGCTGLSWGRRLQKLIIQLEIHGESISQEDVNQKFLRSLSPEWNTHTIMWRNKPEIYTLSLDDLYNNLKIYEPEVKGTSSSNTNTQNVAFVSSNSTRSINRAINTAHGVTTASTQATAINSTTIDNLSDAFICYFFGSKEPRKQEWENSRRSVPVETPASSALVSCDGLGGYDWSDQPEEGNMSYLIDYEEIDGEYVAFGGLGYNAVPPPYTGNFLPPKHDLSGLEEFVNEPIINEPTIKTSEAKASADKPKNIRKNYGPPLIEERISDSEDEAKLKSKN
uniref:Uncharacterized protein n=1 Tax=Tanacetum cinerariifolium TaxID=118510 RepID=A0A699H0Y9_TANCI|nr:hypothetical protein [Tanacetum cinerariifolium]